MRKEELIALAKELLEIENLSTRKDDLAFLKREYRRINAREEETFFEKSLTDEFNAVFEELAKKDPSLNSSPYDDKKAIIAKAKELIAKPGIKDLSKAMNDLFNSFKQAGRCSKEQDDELWAEMKALKDAANKKINDHFDAQRQTFDSRKAKKLEIIEEAKKALELENFKETQAKMDSLMDEWKKVGFAGKECDDELWASFSEVRKQFSIKRAQHAEEMKKTFAERVEKKEEIIKTVKKITADAYFTDEEVKQINDIKREFIKVGFAGKENDDDLWERFNEAYKKYFEEMKFYK